MTIGTYAELKDAVYKFLLRSVSDRVVTDSQVSNYIVLCEAELHRELQIRTLEETAPIMTVANQAWVALPEDYSQIITLEFDTCPYDIDYYTRRELKERFGTTIRRPQGYTILGSKIYFGGVPDDVYDLTLDYYADFAALSDSNTTNPVLTAYPDVYLYGSLNQAAVQLKDADFKSMVEGNYGTIIERIKEQSKTSKMPSKLRMRPRNSIGGAY